MKKTLLAISGMTPQVITETLYVLWSQGELPDSVRIITTTKGKENIDAKLLNKPNGAFYRFCKEYGIDSDSIEFSWETIVIPTLNGKELDDIHNEAESLAFLEACLQETYRLTQHQEDTVYFSLAGGRKTMGAYLSLAVQIYARPQDRLYHVLVSPEFESNRDFFFPPQNHEHIGTVINNKPSMINTKEAEISLINVPFISLREKLTDEALQGPFTPEKLKQFISKCNQPQLILDFDTATIKWDKKELKLPPMQFTLYAFLAQCKKNQTNGSGFLELSEIIRAQSELGKLYDMVQTSNKNKKEFGKQDEELLRTSISKIKKSINGTFGSSVEKQIGIDTKKADNLLYGLKLDPQSIKITGNIYE